MKKPATKSAKRPAKRAAAKLDAVTLEVIRNALPAVANEMAADLQRTSYNMMIYEVRDFCTALIDPNGELISQNVGGVSHFVADLGVIITDGMRRYGAEGFKPGDVIITNHQAVAGQHLNNVVIYMPYFYKGELLMFTMVRAHWIDIGGMSTGFGAGPQVADPWFEGLQLDPARARDLDGRSEVRGREGFDDVGHDARIARSLDEFLLAERGEHHHRGNTLLANLLGSADAIKHRHPDVHQHQIRFELPAEGNGLLAIAGLGHDLITRVDQHLDEVQADERLVLGNKDASPDGHA